MAAVWFVEVWVRGFEIRTLIAVCVFGSVGKHGEYHSEAVASIVLRYWFVPFGGEQENVGICVRRSRPSYSIACFLQVYFTTERLLTIRKN